MDGPVAVRPDTVPDALKCSICLCIATQPACTPCQHLFCYDCIKTAFERPTGTVCPNCRSECHLDQIEPLARGSLLHRIWSDIEVKCQYHSHGCQWTGSIQDEANHRRDSCLVNQQLRQTQQNRDHDNDNDDHDAERQLCIHRFRQENEALHHKVDTLTANMSLLMDEKQELMLRLDMAMEQNENLADCVRHLQCGKEGLSRAKESLIKGQRRLSKQVENLTEEKENLDRMVKVLTREKNRLDGKVQSLNSRISRDENRLNAKNFRIQVLTDEKKKLVRKIASLESQLLLTKLYSYDECSDQLQIEKEFVQSLTKENPFLSTNFQLLIRQDSSRNNNENDTLHLKLQNDDNEINGNNNNNADDPLQGQEACNPIHSLAKRIQTLESEQQKYKRMMKAKTNRLKKENQKLSKSLDAEKEENDDLWKQLDSERTVVERLYDEKEQLLIKLELLGGEDETEVSKTVTNNKNNKNNNKERSKLMPSYSSSSSSSTTSQIQLSTRSNKAIYADQKYKIHVKSRIYMLEKEREDFWNSVEEMGNESDA